MATGGRWLVRLLLVWTPSFAKARAAREVSGDFTGLLADALAKDPCGGLAAFSAAAREAGRRAGGRLRTHLRLGDSFEDAELAWRLISKMSGMRFRVERSRGESIFEHDVCPLLDAGGARLCESFCLPLVEGLTESICPSASVKIIRAAGASRGCAKALVRGT
jgi:hypothetical protein